MKKAIIITGAAVALAGAGFLGYGWYLSGQAETIITENYTIKVPKSFKLEKQDGDHEFTFKCLGEDIVITDEHLNYKPELINELFPYRSSEIIKQMEKLEDCPYTGYFNLAEETVSGKTKTNLHYMLGTDTYFLSADCWSCSSLKASIIKKIMSNVVKSAEYTSDFRIASKPDVYDYEWFSVDTGSKYYLLDTTEDFQASRENGLLCVKEYYAEADSVDEMSFPRVSIGVEKNNDSPADRADEIYNKRLKNKDKYSVMTREKKNRFGFECERFYFEYASKSSDYKLFSDAYFFRNGDLLYSISAVCDTDEKKADIEEMLDGITIKDIK
ncbi:MAG: hypothetical protein IKH78_05160 [Ruminococcus sp.]|nr:hypothetical protein [Ruminococcus sp.]